MVRAPAKSSAATYPTVCSKPIGMPQAIVGMPCSCSDFTTVLPTCDEISSTPSTWPEAT